MKNQQQQHQTNKQAIKLKTMNTRTQCALYICGIEMTKLKWSYMNQSMAQRRATSPRGRLTACSTINMVTRPADGIAAAPTAAATAVNLREK